MASSLSATPPKYEVFLSFRGEDTRNNFVSHLYEALVQRGIVTYMDEHDLQKGQSISPGLMKAIKESQFAIIVFSENYASSTWCLDELVQIMECKKTLIPVFYGVDPSDVRKQKNSFAESFAKHELNYKDKVQIWKEALKQAAGIKGEDVRGRDEASCIKKIVEEIFSKLLPEPSTKDLVGMESRMMELSSLLFKEPDAVRFVGVWGMGGIGKTTIARAIFYNFIRKFEEGCFLQDVSKKRDMMDLQKILLFKVLRLERVYISDAYEGSRMIADRLRFKRVLLVLDDVNNLHQLKSLAGESTWFGPGSRIIITTRDKHLLNKVDDIYKAHLLSNSDAIQLFCRHAFEQNHPDKDYGDLSDRVVSYAKGLPLALKVLGSHLCGQGINVWESTLDKLKDDPEKDIVDVLKISFDGLSNIQQNIFLDIACFYKGWEEDDVKKRLDSRGFHPGAGIPVLIQRALIHILDGGIQMHDLIQEMGRHIVRQKADMEPGKYSRLWTFEDIYDVLINNTGTAEVEALVQEGTFLWSMPLQDGECDMGICEGVFKKINKLRLLDIRDCFFIPDYLPNTLQWLRWLCYPGKYLPKDFRPINLVHLELRKSSIVETPNVSGMPNLEVLDLEGCEDLLEVHPSIGVHKKLVRLYLNNCGKLEKFPRIIQMGSLEILTLGYNKFVSLPESINRLSCLQVLDLSGCNMLEALPELPASIKKLDLDKCTSLTRIPSLVDLLGKYEDLHYLSLLDCLQLVKNPRSPTIMYDLFFEDLHHQFLLAFCDWLSVSNVLCTRQEVVQVYLPWTEIPNWLYQSTMPQVTITSTPSWFNDKLQGFALCAKSDCLRFRLSTCNGLVTLVGDYYSSRAGTFFLYIPISRITRDREWKDQKDSFLFEVTNVGYCHHTSWGIRLVYEGKVDQDISDLTMMNHFAPERKDEAARLKVCVAPRNHEKPRDKQLLNKVGDIYESHLLSNSDAMQLFCWHAFKQNHPDKDYGDLPDRVVSYAHGLLLALKVLGSHLCGQGTDVWESALDRLKNAPEYTIFTSLEISFEGLSNTQQNIFLDIACFYRGWKEDDVKKRLYSRGFHPVEGITVLIQRSLIHILDKEIQMHDLIQEMGQHIVRQKANFKPERYSRLWFQNDICNVLKNNTGTAEIECLVDDEWGMSFSNGINLSKAFRKMNKLRLLDLLTEENKFSGDSGYLPNTLQCLSWPYYPGKYLPKDFRPINIVHLNLSQSSIVETPDVSGMPNLEVLDLFNCENLLAVHPSIGDHKKLVRLNFGSCYNLEKFQGIIQMESLEILDLLWCSKFHSFPKIHRNMSRLRILNLCYTKIEELPWSVGGLASLQELNLRRCKDLRGLPSSLCGLEHLEIINLGGCSKLEYFFENPDGDEAVPCFDSQPLPLKRKRVEYHGPSKNVNMFSALLSLPSLRTLDMSNCNVTEVIIPESIGCLASLQELNLSGNNFVSLPESINCITCLQFLGLRCCGMLEALPELPSSIKELDLEYCTSLTRIPSLVDLLRKYEHLHRLSLVQNPISPTIVSCTRDLLGKLKDWQHLSLKECLELTPQSRARDQFLVAFRDWRSVSNVLCTRQEVVQVYLPRIEIPDWLYQCRWDQVTVTFSPSWYNDKLRGFALCAKSDCLRFSLSTCNGLVTLAGDYYSSRAGTGFLYIPIGTITSGRDQWKDQNDCLLFEVTNARWNDERVTSWGISLVYEGEVDNYISHLTFTNDYDDYRLARVKVCVAPRNES